MAPLAFGSKATWREALEAFERLLTLEASHREAALSALKQEKPDVYQQVLTLIGADRKARAEDFLADNPADLIGEQSHQAGDKYGHYRLERLLGSGGMGG